MKRGVITTLRDFVPIRPLGREEALRVAELQATRFLALCDVTEPPVPERIISELPRVQVERFSPLPVSGATQWAKGRWLIILNGAEPITRQRHTLAHEAKHIFDNRFVAILYGRIPVADRRAFIEQVCDYFAGTLLVPRPWLKRAWTSGTQRLPELAAVFGVSQAAIAVRLAQVGLTEPPARCGRVSPTWALPFTRGSGTSAQYERAPSVFIT